MRGGANPQSLLVGLRLGQAQGGGPRDHVVFVADVPIVSHVARVDVVAYLEAGGGSSSKRG